MLFDIPRAPSYKLSRAPLVQALAQVRYPLVADFQTLSGVAQLQALLRAEFPYMQQSKTQEFGFAFGPAGPSAAANEVVNWMFTNDSGDLVEVGSGSATISSGNYLGVEAFAQAFELLLSALSKLGIPRCDRIGSRYLSIAESIPAEPASARAWFRPEIVGWSGSSAVAVEKVANSITQTQLITRPVENLSPFPADVQAMVRHGFVPAGTLLAGIPPLAVEAPSFLMDLDVFCAGHQPLAVPQLVEQFRILHSEIDNFFHWSLTAEGREHFGLENKDS